MTKNNKMQTTHVCDFCGRKSKSVYFHGVYWYCRACEKERVFSTQQEAERQSAMQLADWDYQHSY